MAHHRQQHYTEPPSHPLYTPFTPAPAIGVSNTVIHSGIIGGWDTNHDNTIISVIIRTPDKDHRYHVFATHDNVFLNTSDSNIPSLITQVLMLQHLTGSITLPLLAPVTLPVEQATSALTTLLGDALRLATIYHEN